jgi:hypothetical protein
MASWPAITRRISKSAGSRRSLASVAATFGRSSADVLTRFLLDRADTGER